MSKNLPPVEKSMAQLAPNERAIVAHFTDEALSAQLLEVGLVPGQEVTVLCKGPLGSPLCLKVGKNHLAIRPQEASQILVLA
jgi:Fe2+ transport system protein FeoA